MRPTLVRTLLAVVVGLVIILGVTTCNARRDGARSERIAQMEANGYRAAKASLGRRRVTDSVTAVAKRDSARLARQVASNRKVEARLLERLAANDSVLSAYRLNPGDSIQAYTLSVALARTTEVARLYRDSTSVLLGSVERMLASQSEEREAWLAEREQNTILLAAKDSLISALRESEQGCRILFVACPSRVQSVGIGAMGVLLLLLL